MQSPAGQRRPESRERSCTRSIPCNARATATRRGWRWRSCDIPYELVEVDILQGESRTPEFLAKNPDGHVPLLEVAPGRYLPESECDPVVHRRRHADSRRKIASTARKRCNGCSSNSIQLEPNLGAAWFWLTLIKGGRELQLHAVEDWTEQGYRALVRDGEASRDTSVLRRRDVTRSPTSRFTPTPTLRMNAASISAAFPRSATWLKRVAEQPGHVTMDWEREHVSLAG